MYLWILKERWPRGQHLWAVWVAGTWLKWALFGQVLVYLWNCSKRFWGRKVKRVYLVVRILLPEYLLETLAQSRWNRPLLGNTTRCCVRLQLCLSFSGDSSGVASAGDWRRPSLSRHCHRCQEESTERAISGSTLRSENRHTKSLWSEGTWCVIAAHPFAHSPIQGRFWDAAPETGSIPIIHLF